MTSLAELAVFSSEYPPNILGGLGTHVEHMTAALRCNWNVNVFVPQSCGYTPLPGIRLEEIPGDENPDSPEFWLLFARNAAHRAENLAPHPDVLQCHDWSTALAGVAARRRLARPLVFNVHLPQRIAVHAAIENITLLAADLIIVNSCAVRDEIMARGLPLRSVEVVPNGVDAQLFYPAADWPAHKGYVLFAGRLVPQKGTDTVMRAFAVMLRRLDSRLVIAGDGPLELYLARLARHLGIPDYVSFEHWQTGPALVELFQNAAAVAVPSVYEPFGIVVLEAMACGRPVIASDTGGLREIVEQGQDGYLVKVGDYLDFARRLLWLLTDSDLSRRLGAAARRKAESYSWEAIAARTTELYREVRYAGESWFQLPEAQAALAELSAELDAEQREVLAEITGPRKKT